MSRMCLIPENASMRQNCRCRILILKCSGEKDKSPYRLHTALTDKKKENVLKEEEITEGLEKKNLWEDNSRFFVLCKKGKLSEAFCFRQFFYRAMIGRFKKLFFPFHRKTLRFSSS